MAIMVMILAVIYIIIYQTFEIVGQESYVKHLLWDAKVTQKIVPEWQQKSLK